MDFSHTANGKGTQLTKIAIVAALHVAVGAAVVSSMNTKAFKMPQLVEDLVMINVEAPKPPPPPPPPPEPPTPKVKPVVTPKVQVPVVEVDVPQEPVEAPLIAATTETVPQEPADPGPPADPAPAAPPSNNTGKLFTAALANAGDCATPDYPASAARNGETGTVNLALLIGVDGRVTDSKIQKSSGSRALDRAAQSALSLCKFKPAMAGGTPEPAWGQIAYVWNLD